MVVNTHIVIMEMDKDEVLFSIQHAISDQFLVHTPSGPGHIGENLSWMQETYMKRLLFNCLAIQC